MATIVEVLSRKSINPNRDISDPPSHHVGNPPKHFRNPWPSAKPITLLNIIRRRFGTERNYIPVPENRDELVEVRIPDWGAKDDPDGTMLKATWIGHASWLIETGAKRVEKSTDSHRGVRILLDPFFSERTSPFQWMGPKRYTPTPCSIAELPQVDMVVISHNHYDHLDLHSITELWTKRPGIQFFAPLGNKSWFLSLDIGIKEENVTELDWWEEVDLHVEGVGQVKLMCTPAQHASRRGAFDQDKTLWSSWVIESPASADSTESSKRLYFAGDTGYRAVPVPLPTREEEEAQPACPAFKEIGDALGPFDLALLPIGLCTPRDFMSSVHCAPEDAIRVHKDIQSKRSIGMHYGTVRGGVSEQYEDVREPPRRWKELCLSHALKWGEETGLCAVGETVVV